MTVVERRTGLMWQRNVDLPSADLGDALTHIEKLNRQRFAGFDDWRIPTLEEAATLLEPRRSDAAHLYLDPVFGSRHSDPEGAFLRATQSHDAVLGFISECNESERKPEPPWCIITADHYPVSEPYRVEGWHINFLEGQVSWLIEVPELLACRSVGGDEVYGA